MIQSKKQSLIVIGVFTLILLLGTTTYAFFNYTRTGLANNIRVGRISFNSSQSNSINLTNVFPITSEEAETDTTNAKSTSITITGDTDYSGGVEYLVTTSDVNMTVGGKQLPVALEIDVEGNNSKTLGTLETGDYYTNRENYSVSKYKIEYRGKINEGAHLLVGYIAKNTTSGTADGIGGVINIKAYIDKDKILVSDTYDGSESDNMGTPRSMAEGKVVFTTTEWNGIQNSPLSFKIKVEANEGIWVEEESTPASCFTTSGPRAEYAVKEMTSERLSTCTDYFTNGGWDISGGYENFCLGTATYYNETFSEMLAFDRFDDYILGQLVNLDIIEQVGYKTTIMDYDASCGSIVSIPSYMETSYKTYEFNNSIGSIEISKCVDYITNDMGWSVDTGNGETMENFCNGTGTMWGQTFQEQLDYQNFSESNLTYFVTNGIVIEENHVIGRTKVVQLEGEYDYEEEDNKGAFANKGLTSVKLPDTLVQIGSSSFAHNQLSTVVVPNSVKTIWTRAFYDNQITSLSLPDNISSIYYEAFSMNQLVTITIPDGIKYIYPSIGIFTYNPITTVIVDGYISGTETGNANCKESYEAFLGLSQIQNVIISDRVQSIGACAFYKKNVSNVTFGSGITSIDRGAFRDNSITNLTIPNNVTIIGDQAFDENNLISANIGNGINSIGIIAFGMDSNAQSSSITIAKSCSTIKSMNNYPWFNAFQNGVTIYGLNNEICDTY